MASICDQLALILHSAFGYNMQRYYIGYLLPTSRRFVEILGVLLDQTTQVCRLEKEVDKQRRKRMTLAAAGTNGGEIRRGFFLAF